MGKLLDEDKKRYGGKGMPWFQLWWRKAQECGFPPLRVFYYLLLKFTRERSFVEISHHVKCGPGLYIGHPFGITINPNAVIGSNVSISKGVTIGQENRGKRKGYPTIGDNVWIGTNAIVVGKINIGNDVLIAPNSFVNCDVPDHSVVYGNPCIIKHRENATEGYLN